MRRLALAALVASAFTMACSDQRIDTPTESPVGTIPVQNVAGDPADAAAIRALIIQLFGTPSSCSGNCNAATVRFDQIAALYTNCDLVPPQSPCNQAGAIDNTYSLIDYILGKWNAGSLNTLTAYPGGTPQAVTDLINLLYRYVGINSVLCSLGTDCNATVYQPGSPATILTTPSGQAGISLPPGTGTVTAPTVISVYRIDDPSVLLATQLDQYPYRYFYSSSSSEGTTTPFGQDVVVEVCLQTGLTFPPGALARLALAHSIAEPPPYQNIQILPPGPSFLAACGTLSANSAASGSLAFRGWQYLTGRLSSVLIPAPLYALGAGTGTTGTTKNLSPFGAVDPLGYITPNSPTSGDAPEGGTVPAPSARVVTPAQLAAANPTGPGMTPIPVTFTVTGGGGCFANPCTPSSPTTLVVNTDASGYASVPTWTLGAGANTVTAAAAIPCAAPVVSNPANCGSIVTTTGQAVLTFSATGHPPTQLGFSAGTLTILSGLQSQIPAYAPGVPFNVSVLVQDDEVPAQTVPGSSASVTLAVTNGGTLVCPSGCTQTAVGGVATFTGVYVTSTGTFQLTATSPPLTPAPAAPNGGFSVVAPPSSAANIAIFAGDNQTALEGSTLGVAAGSTSPAVRVTDSYGNPVGGAGVTFAVASGGGSAGSPGATTNTSGMASSTWTIVAGSNTLNASITALGSMPYVSFTAIGTSATTTLIDCPPSSSNGDDLSRGFYWAPGKAKTLKQATVYLSAGGPAAGPPKPYTIMLTALAGAYNGAVIGTSTQTVYLNGNSSQNLASQFPFTGSLSIPGSAKNVAFKFTIVNPGDGAKLSFNVGPCGLGTTPCSNLPAACSALTETTDVAPPLSTVRRKGVAVKLLGN